MAMTPLAFLTAKSTIITPSSRSVKPKLTQILCLIITAVWLAACNAPAVPLLAATQTDTPEPTLTHTASATSTGTPTATITASPTLTSTPTRTPTTTPTLAPLETFSTDSLRRGILPQAYIKDPCAYLAMRWSPEGSPPGTVVLPIMFHSIVQNGSQIADPNKDISADQFLAFVSYARSLGFETITTQQLADFLYENYRIPPRSMLIIVDDRRPGMIREWIMPVLEEYGWTVTSAYIADPDSFNWAWDLMDQLFTTGRMDVQSHGYTGQLYILPDTPVEQIENEIWNSTTVLEQRFGTRPIAFIWPGGNFTPLSAAVARLGAYELGFTAYSRGPLLFNWVPLGEEERAVEDPLMVLPRAWSSSANFNLDEAVKVSEQAAAFASQKSQVEADWYTTYCGGELDTHR